MNYTEKYHLPQWEENDRVMRTDFNQAMAGIENGLNKNEQAAATAQSTAEKLPYVIGTYTGSKETITVNLGFRPSFVIVSGQREQTGVNTTGEIYLTVGLTGGDLLTHRIKITDTGFIAYPDRYENYSYPMTNYTGWVYNYIAFR